MPDWILVFGYTLAAGLAMPLGAWLASIEHIGPSWLEAEFRHSVIAFGGGVLFSAISLVLVPEGIQQVSVLTVALCFSLGGIFFMFIDIVLAKSKHPASQLVAMVSDFVPEALAMGATFAVHQKTGLLLAALITLQNLPEGFNALREMASVEHFNQGRFILFLFVLAFLGPAAGLIGYFYLADFPAALSAIMLFAAGGILYIIFQDIAPQAKLEYHWAPPLGAVAGFLCGLIGQMLITG